MNSNKKWFLIIVLIIYLFSCNNTNDNAKQIEEAIKFATDYSDAKSNRGWNDEYWDHLCAFRNSSEYNSTARLARADGPYYTNEEEWNWLTDSLRLEYCSMRNNLK
jgi:hypothetical protein